MREAHGFKQMEWTDHDIELWCFDLALSGYKLQQAVAAIRPILEEIAGTDLDGWDAQDLERYMDLALAYADKA